jgi:colicin import membrane protein
LTANTKEAQDRAEANFKRKELQNREASKAWAEYEAGRVAEREKTARLRQLREAKEAADAAAAAQAKAAGAALAKEAADAKASKAAAKLTAGAAKKPAKKRVRALADADAEDEG